MDFTEEHKHDIEMRIVRRIILAIEKQELTSADLPNIADLILARIDTIKTQDELAEFLTELSARWSVFKDVLEIELGRVKSNLEKKIARDVLNLANAGNIEEAIRLARTMTETT